MLLSDDYKGQLRQLHESSVWGDSAGRWSGEVRHFAQKLKTSDLLDYGCGRGTLKDQLAEFHFAVHEYDPGIPGKDAAPAPAGLVVCLDVLEHVEPEFIDDVIRDLDRLGNRGVIAVIALYRGGRCLPDGRPCHLIVEPEEWWKEKISRLWAGRGQITFETRRVPGRPSTKRARDCLVVKLEKPL